MRIFQVYRESDCMMVVVHAATAMDALRQVSQSWGNSSSTLVRDGSRISVGDWSVVLNYSAESKRTV